MKTREEATILILALTLVLNVVPVFSTVNESAAVPSSGMIFSPTAGNSSFAVGMNYLSAGNDWDDSDRQLDADFQRFADDGIRHISARIMWSRLEPNYNPASAQLDQASLNNYKRVLEAAKRHNISVTVDFWTHFQDVHWDMPRYIESIFDILPTNETGHNLWLRYVKAVVGELKSYPSVEAWAILNEPFYNTASQRDPMQQLIRNEVNAIKSVDNTRPIICRFTLSYTPGSGRFDSSIYDLFDIFAVTIYLDPSNPSDTRYNGRWSYWDKTVADCKARGLPLWVIEFGDDSADQEHNRLHYELSLQKFSTENVTRAYAWAWQTRSASSEGFNIYDGSQPRPAYYELAEYGRNE